MLGFNYTDKLVINLFLILYMKRCRRNHSSGIKEDDQEPEGVSIHLNTRTGLQPNKAVCESHMNDSAVKREVQNAVAYVARENSYSFVFFFFHKIDGLLKLIQAK